MENNTLHHHGVKGQKWGFRRYQNKDGTLTRAGKKRQLKNLEKAREAAAAKREHEAGKKKALQSGSASEVLKYRGELTKLEMDAAWARIQWEQNMSGAAAKESAEKGKKFFDNVERVTGYAVTTAKAWNMAANVFNAFNTQGVSLPKFDTNITNGNRKERKAEQKEQQKAKDAQKKREEQEAQRETKHKERAEKKAAKQAAEEKTKASKTEEKAEKVHGTVEGEGTSKGSHKNWDTSKFDKDIIDIVFKDDTPVSEVRESRLAAIGQNYVNEMFLLEDKSR